MTVDISRYSFTGGENARQIENLTLLPKADQDRLIGAGIDVGNGDVSGAFMQLNHADVHCHTRQDGLEMLSHACRQHRDDEQTIHWSAQLVTAASWVLRLR